MSKLSFILLLLLLLAACQPRSIKPSKVASWVPLDVTVDYQIIGKMSFSDGQDGGSGRLNWQQQQGFVSAQLKAPLGVKSWQIAESPAGAKLISAEGLESYAESATSLISHQLGWAVPWVALKSWVIGQAFDDTNQLKQNDSGDFVLQEQGWEITYSRFQTFEAGILPMRMTARKNNFTIKIAVKSWNW
ncbi:lipoprotein insertase outer membrane protein LolB [Marinicella sp. S1101]|uniref:lipoprotein insertase outer membrane protein LolB n=1 Tax=Marinicella marina TaxID=2996016 RepID=UPI002260F5C4|nr:lipoprotein insertase outer membrane protein LolB [Marinicella marina]MCX7552966.1 lipoprotein insertase outer membrane protein LolB [Marinicella marina]MDJ1139724.1 lipoprotein insertase outer membrane protein LolB [Marinicella marina]